MDTILQLQHLEMVYNRGTANESYGLRNIELNVRRGEFVVLVGANGSGKTSLLRAIAGNTCATGDVILNGIHISAWPTHLRASRVSVINQDYGTGTAGDLTVLENLAIASLRKMRSHFRAAVSRSFRNACKEKLATFGGALSERLDTPASKLSGGERQLLCVIMALSSSASIVLCDEPTAAVDSVRKAAIEGAVLQYVERTAIPVLWVTHDADQVLRMANKLVVMHAGGISKVLDSDQLRSVTVAQLLQWMNGYGLTGDC